METIGDLQPAGLFVLDRDKLVLPQGVLFFLMWFFRDGFEPSHD